MVRAWLRSFTRFSGRFVLELDDDQPEPETPAAPETAENEITQPCSQHSQGLTADQQLEDQARVAAQNDVVCYYVVWKIRGNLEDSSTIYVATRARGWHQLVQRFPGHRYSPGTTRLRRCDNLLLAITLYASERDRHGCERHPRIREC